MRAPLSLEALAKRFRLSRMRGSEGLGAFEQEVYLGVCRVRAADLGNSGNGYAPEQGAADYVVHDDPFGQQPLERYLCPPTPSPIRPGQLQDSLAHAAQVASGNGRSNLSRCN